MVIEKLEGFNCINGVKRVTRTFHEGTRTCHECHILFCLVVQVNKAPSRAKAFIDQINRNRIARSSNSINVIVYEKNDSTF